MELRDEVLSRLDEILELLKCVPAAEVDVGWNSSTVNNWSSFLDKLRTAIGDGGPLAVEYQNATLLRWLDAQGICGGRIADLIVEVDGGLRKLVAVGSKN